MEPTLPSSWYQRQDIFALEREHIFFDEWMCVAREEDVPNTADHRLLDVLGQSLLLVRNADGAPKVFYNVCRHRGARLCSPAVSANEDRVPVRGGVMANGTILCPYHAWTYDLDGQLLRAPHMSTGDGFDPRDVKLYSVPVRTWGGFIFVNLSRDSPAPFDTQIKSVLRRLERYPLDRLRTARTIDYDVAANWKILCENYNECYHCGPVHPELCRVVPAFRERGGAELDWERGIPHRDGADTFTTSGTSSRPSFPGLNSDELVRHKGELVYPNLFLSAAREHVAAFVLQPIDAGHTRVSCHFLFDPETMRSPDFDPSDAIDFWHLVNRQDWTVCELVQQGIGARVHEAGWFSPMEDWNLDIRRYVNDRIGPHVQNESG